jgi:hypothetical protein
MTSPPHFVERVLYLRHKTGTRGVTSRAMLDALAPLLVLLAFVLLAVTSWFWGEDSLTGSQTDSGGRPVRWSL